MKDHQQPPDELQVIEQLLDLDQLLLEFVAPAFSPIGAPARRVGKLLRALLLLNIKNVRSEKFLVGAELKHNLLYRWFVRLEKDETINDSFRIALVRLRARLAFRLKHEPLACLSRQDRRAGLSPSSFAARRRSQDRASATPGHRRDHDCARG